ncbi:MAG: hypothetical protein OEV00_16440, partial [Acidobacteriota bacterium]|nr:hypothetical protein [Acidobacteriota bacterium]
VLSSIHTHGVALGDLHHRDVLLDANGRVTIVDFATAWCPRSGDPLRSRVFRRMRDQDLVGLARMKQRYWGIPADVAFADCPPKAIARYRRSRNWKSRWQRLRGRSGS